MQQQISKLIPRQRLVNRVLQSLDEAPVTVLSGARQTGKTTLTKSMHIALADLGLHRLFVVYPGKERYRLHEKIEVIPLMECVDLKETETKLGRSPC